MTELDQPLSEEEILRLIAEEEIVQSLLFEMAKKDAVL
jgi:hypothetical protein